MVQRQWRAAIDLLEQGVSEPTERRRLANIVREEAEAFERELEQAALRGARLSRGLAKAATREREVEALIDGKLLRVACAIEDSAWAEDLVSSNLNLSLLLRLRPLAAAKPEPGRLTRYRFAFGPLSGAGPQDDSVETQLHDLVVEGVASGIVETAAGHQILFFVLRWGVVEPIEDQFGPEAAT